MSWPPEAAVVLAMDISARALEQARIDQPDNVELRRGSIPADWPPGRFDLIVLSEMGYYLDERDCRRLAQLAMTGARDLIAVHWRHRVGDYPLTGDQCPPYSRPDRRPARTRSDL